MIVAPNVEIIESLGDARDVLSKSLDVALTDSVQAAFPFHSSVLPNLLNASGSFPVRTSLTCFLARLEVISLLLTSRRV